MHNAAPRMPDDRLVFFELARVALGTTQEALGKMLGVSRRTAQRWGASGIPGYELTKLARLVLPRDRALAVKIAAAAGTTLEAAGMEPPPPPPAPPPDGVVDAVVCAAAEAMEMMPKEVRPGLHAAFARAAPEGPGRPLGAGAGRGARAREAKESARVREDRQRGREDREGGGGQQREASRAA